MGEFSATYFDGKSAKAHPVRVVFDASALRLEGPTLAEPRSFPLKDCLVTAALGDGPRRIRLDGGGWIETNALAAVEALEKAAGGGRGFALVSRLEARWRFVAAALALVAGVAYLFVAHGLPYVAEKVALALPAQTLAELDAQAIDALDGELFEPTALPQERREEIEGWMTRVRKDQGSSANDYRLFFRASPKLGANAFALPGGTLVVTDAMAQYFVSEERAAGVFAHEIAHVELRHGVRSLLQKAGLWLVVSMALGDVSAVTSFGTTLPTLLIEAGYSREFEREADADAARYLKSRGWNPDALGDLLRELQKNSSGSAGLLSTHPGVEERIRTMAEAAR